MQNYLLDWGKLRSLRALKLYVSNEQFHAFGATGFFMQSIHWSDKLCAFAHSTNIANSYGIHRHLRKALGNTRWWWWGRGCWTPYPQGSTLNPLLRSSLRPFTHRVYDGTFLGTTPPRSRTWIQISDHFIQPCHIYPHPLTSGQKCSHAVTHVMENKCKKRRRSKFRLSG